MKTKKRILPALVLSAFATLGATAAQAQQFSNVYVFGDSLSDAGYFRPALIAGGVPSSLAALLGRFTTNPGPVYSDILFARYVGGTAQPSNVSGGTIYAQGGARVDLASASTPAGAAQRPVSTQISEYLGAGGRADPNALYAVWAGANDIFQNLGALSAGAITAAQLQTNVLAAANAEIAQIARLRAAGARYIIVFGLPDIGATPQFSASATTAGQVTALSVGYNTTLFSGLAAAGIPVIAVDSFAFLSEIRANPSAFGLTNVTAPACAPLPPFSTSANSQFCTSGNLVAANAQNTYLFADGVHPTTAGQRLIADFVKNLIEGPVQYSLMPEAAMRMRSAHVRTVRDGVAAASQAPGKFGVYVSADGADLEIAPGGVNGPAGGLESRVGTRAFTLGVNMRASESVSLGAAIGRSSFDGGFAGDGGSFDMRDTTYSVGASLRRGGLWGGAVLSIGDININEGRRNIVLGTQTRVAKSTPKGNNASGFMVAGYDFALGPVRIGPVASLHLQNVEIAGFDESEAGSANLRIGTQKRRSEVWGLGARASMTFGDWTPWVRVTSDKERRDDVRFITATPLSLATANAYNLPAYRPDSRFLTLNAGVTGRITEKVGLAVSYYKVQDRDQLSEDGLTATVSLAF